MRHRAFCLALLALCFVVYGCNSDHRDQKVWLWAWERNDDLTWLDTSRVSVAYLAGSYQIGGESFAYRPRMQRLQIPDGIATMPVLRIESTDSIDSVSIGQLTSHILRNVRNPNGWLQLDFDAKLSERVWYGRLIKRIKTERPGLRLSITALASWVMSDPWIDSLPIDEAVPMFFDMGIDERNIITMLSRGKDVRAKKAQGIYGLALDEEIPVDVRESKVYFFSHRTWDKRDLQNALKHYDLDE